MADFREFGIAHGEEIWTSDDMEMTDLSEYWIINILAIN